MDYEDAATFQRLGGARFDLTGGATAFGAMSEQRDFLFAAVAKQRREPGPGLIGQIIRDEGDAITDADLAGLADGVFTGGFETTAGMIALSTIVLLRDPEHAEIMRTGAPEEIDSTIEELLRYLSVVQLAFPRFAKEDMSLGGRVAACPTRGGTPPPRMDSIRGGSSSARALRSPCLCSPLGCRCG